MNTIYKSTFAGAAFVCLVAASTMAATYAGGATFVARDDQLGQLLDAGGVLCHGTTEGVGGACLAWADLGNESYVRVVDELAGTDVAFQVCVDNNGDGLCGDTSAGGSIFSGACRDTILFSHDDQGNFFNPLGPLPTSFPSGCTGGFPGWVVFLCEGVHDDGVSAHQHAVTAGTVTAADSGSGNGTFCGGVRQLNVPPKPYVIVDEGDDVRAAVEQTLQALEDAVGSLLDQPGLPVRP